MISQYTNAILLRRSHRSLRVAEKVEVVEKVGRLLSILGGFPLLGGALLGALAVCTSIHFTFEGFVVSKPAAALHLLQ